MPAASQMIGVPPELAELLKAELAAGNELVGIEMGVGKDSGKVALVLRNAFQGKTAASGITCRELTRGEEKILEFVTADERISLRVVKLLKKALPESMRKGLEQAEAKSERLRQKEIELEIKAAQKAVNDPSFSAAGRRFMESLPMTFDKWHDGTGHDLEALKQVPPEDLIPIETLLIYSRPRDWRDIEALSRIDSPRARAAIEAALKSPNPQVRREAARHAGEKVNPADREKFLLEALRSSNLYEGLGEAIDEVAEFHPPAVIDALLRGAYKRDGEAAIHFAAMLFFLNGKSVEPFDWNHRPFFLRFGTSDRAERTAVFRELCEIIGVDPQKYL